MQNKHFTAFFAASALLLQGAATAAQGDAELQNFGFSVTAAKQKWRNGVETICRGQNEGYQDFEKRLNLRMRELGQRGWEVVSVAASPIPGQNCMLFAYKQPDPN